MATSRSTWLLFKKHQASSLASTAIDFATMIAMHQVVGLGPALATAVGAFCGAFANFMLGRHWAFRATNDRAYSQALRYALVALASLALNTLGEHLLAERLHVQYVVARLGVALAVSVLWNFPLQRAFVFAEPPEGRRLDSRGEQR